MPSCHAEERFEPTRSKIKAIARISFRIFISSEMNGVQLVQAFNHQQPVRRAAFKNNFLNILQNAVSTTCSLMWFNKRSMLATRLCGYSSSATFSCTNLPRLQSEDFKPESVVVSPSSQARKHRLQFSLKRHLQQCPVSTPDRLLKRNVEYFDHANLGTWELTDAQNFALFTYAERLDQLNISILRSLKGGHRRQVKPNMDSLFLIH